MVLILKGKSFVGLIICLYKIKSKKYEDLISNFFIENNGYSISK